MVTAGDQLALFGADRQPAPLCPHGYIVERWWSHGWPDQYPTDPPSCPECSDRAFTRAMVHYLLAAAAGRLRPTGKQPGMAVNEQARRAVRGWLLARNLTYAQAQSLSADQNASLLDHALNVLDRPR